MQVPAELLASVLVYAAPTVAPPVNCFHWVDKLPEIRVTGWAMEATAWVIAHPVNMLAEALSHRHPKSEQCELQTRMCVFQFPPANTDT